MHKAVKEMMETFMRAGCTTDAIADRLTPFDEFNDFIGLPRSSAREKRYGVTCRTSSSPVTAASRC